MERPSIETLWPVYLDLEKHCTDLEDELLQAGQRIAKIEERWSASLRVEWDTIAKLQEDKAKLQAEILRLACEKHDAKVANVALAGQEYIDISQTPHVRYVAVEIDGAVRWLKVVPSKE